MEAIFCASLTINTNDGKNNVRLNNNINDNNNIKNDHNNVFCCYVTYRLYDIISDFWSAHSLKFSLSFGCGDITDVGQIEPMRIYASDVMGMLMLF